MDGTSGMTYFFFPPQWDSYPCDLPQESRSQRLAGSSESDALSFFRRTAQVDLGGGVSERTAVCDGSWHTSTL